MSKIEIVRNKEIARRLSISESSAGRLVRTYRDAKQLRKNSPIDWCCFCEFYNLPVNQG